MVKNREELLQVASNNANQLKGHLRKAINDFLRSQRVTPEELAYVLGITNGEMSQILEGDGNVTVDVLSKLLVATDMAVEIKPVRQTPLGAYGRNMPRSGAYPGPNGIPVGPDGRPLPPPPGFPRPGFGGAPAPGMFDPRQREERAVDNVEVPMETTGPVRDSRGRFTKKTATRRPAATQRPRATEANPYSNLSADQLVGIIRSNIWDGEIDINRASHDELAAFVANKERIMRERSGEQEAPRDEQPQPQPEPRQGVNGGGNSLNQFLEMLGNVAREAERNPELMSVIERFMPRK